MLYKFIINESWLCDYAESSQPFDEIKHRHILKEVGDVAGGGMIGNHRICNKDCKDDKYIFLYELVTVLI